ncbi:hypothetical protein BGLA2_280094 [Burkholderia gladioli]|nr:hypothetical protein BGLA2_280094 [Burkholderia gladioli]
MEPHYYNRPEDYESMTSIQK